MFVIVEAYDRKTMVQLANASLKGVVKVEGEGEN